MKTLDQYLARRMVVTIFQALLALVAIYILIDLLTREGALSSYDVPFGIVVRYYLNLTPQIIYRIAPFAMLVSSLLVLGDAVQSNEVTAVLSGGISLRRFVVVPVLVALLYSIGLFVMDARVGVEAAKEANRIREGYFSLNPDMKRTGISWANLSGGWTCHIAKFNRIALTGENVLMYSRTPDSVQQIEARRIYWDKETKQWILEDGRWFTMNAQETVASGSRVRQRPAPFSEPPEVLFALDKPMETKTPRQLLAEIGNAEKRAVPASDLWVDYHVKFSQPALSFVMIWLAIPFAMRLRRGGLAISFATSTIIAIVYLLVFSVTMELGYAERLAPPVAAWLANGAFFVFGVILFWRTPT